MMKSFLRCADTVPDFVPTLVAEGVEPTCLRQINDQMNTAVVRSSRAVVAAQLQVPVSRLPAADQLLNEPGDTFTKLSSAIVFGRRHVLASPAHRQLQRMASAAGHTGRLEIRFNPILHANIDRTEIDVYLPESVSQIPAGERPRRDAALKSYTRQRVWGRANVSQPVTQNRVARFWVEETEATTNYRDAWRSVYRPSMRDVYLHFGMVTAAECTRWMPQAVSNSLLGAIFVSALAVMNALVGLCSYGLADLVMKLWYRSAHRDTSYDGQAALLLPPLNDIWPELANPFTGDPDTAQLYFDALRHKTLLTNVMLDEAGDSLQDFRTIAGQLNPINSVFLDMNCPVPPQATLDAYYKKLQILKNNSYARPFFPTERLLVALAAKAATQRPQTTWSACAAALGQAHRRRDAWMV